MTAEQKTGSLRWMQPEDLPAMHSIYSWYVNHSAWNLDWQPQSLETFSSFLMALSHDWPVLTALDPEGEIIGYGYAHPALEKKSYQTVAELTIYFVQGPHYGLADRMLDRLKAIAFRQNIHWLISCITQGNASSIALNQRHGFVLLGTLPQAGCKQGEWHDVVWYGLQIRRPEADKTSCPVFVPLTRLTSEEKEALLQNNLYS